MTYYFLNNVANDGELTQKSIITSIIASLMSELTCKLIKRIPGLRLLTASRTHVESLGKPWDVNKHSRSLAW